MKTPRTAADYPLRILRDIISDDSSSKPQDVKEPSLIGEATTLPLRARLTYTGSTQTLTPTNKAFLTHWAQNYASNPEPYLHDYADEMLFEENGVPYWLILPRNLLPQLKSQWQNGDRVEVLLIRIQESQDGKTSSALLIERVQKPE